MMQKCPNFRRINIWFHKFCQINAEIFAKKCEWGSDKYEIYCVEQLGRTEKKKLKIAFLSDQPLREQISSKYLLPSLSSNESLARFLLATFNWSSTFSSHPVFCWLMGLQSTRTKICKSKRKCISNILSETNKP